jgi:hypothetical protein
VFLKADAEGATSLAHILHIAIRASELVDSTFIQTVLFLNLTWFYGQGLANGVVCGKRHLDRRIFERFGDKIGFFAYISKFYPFVWGAFRFLSTVVELFWDRNVIIIAM